MENNTKIKDLRPEMRPDEKFLSMGAEALSDAELLAMIIRTGSSKEPSIKLAERILSSDSDGSLNLLNMFACDINELMKIEGIGKVKALQIKALCELSTRISRSNAKKCLNMNNPGSVSDYYMERLRHLKQEVVVELMLTSSCDLINEKTLFRGSATNSLFSPREIFLEALKAEAVNIILLHNHPSGNPLPSRDDIIATQRVKLAGEYIGIFLLDHIIIGDNKYISMKEEGLLKDECEVRS